MVIHTITNATGDRNVYIGAMSNSAIYLSVHKLEKYSSGAVYCEQSMGSVVMNNVSAIKLLRALLACMADKKKYFSGFDIETAGSVLRVSPPVYLDQGVFLRIVDPPQPIAGEVMSLLDPEATMALVKRIVELLVRKHTTYY